MAVCTAVEGMNILSERYCAVSLAKLTQPNVCRHDSYGNQYPGQGTPPAGSYPNQQPGMYPQQQQVNDPSALQHSQDCQRLSPRSKTLTGSSTGFLVKYFPA